MNRKISFFAALLISASLCFANDSTKIVLKTYAPEPQHPVVFKLIGEALSSYHYRKLNIDDSLSSAFLDNYIKHLDPAHAYFLQSDVSSFGQYRYILDDDLKNGNPKTGFDIYNIYQQRIEDRINFTLDLLKTEMTFNTNDSFQSNREEANFPKDYKELDDLWRKKIKYEVLVLKSGDKDYKACTDIVAKRYQNLYKQLSKTKNEDVFSFYANALTEIADPHTNYFSPRMAEDFNQHMSLSLEGIGATLQTDNEYTKVTTIVKGGPADKSKKIFAGDKIVAVGQGKEGEMVSVIDWRIDDVVALIRGKKGTQVKLEIIPHDVETNKTKTIEITRDRIVLEDQASKSSIKEIERNGKKYSIGVIDVPAFYLDFARASQGEKDYKSTTRDVRRLIEELKKQKVNGIVIDLRSNGGGSLQEAIELTGLFIKTGPVVQVKDAFGIVKVEKDNDESILWDGPLAVLVNRFSASASEIFAAAMQDYGRAVILGEQTYGKGTVQNSFNLNQFIQIDGKKLGDLHLTIAKFYRISGGSTQHKGVVPDIEFPSAYEGDEYGEDASKFALPYDEIQKAAYDRVADLSGPIRNIKQKHELRMKDNDEYKYLLEDIEVIEKTRAKQYTNINEEKYKQENKDNEAKNKAREEARKKAKEAKGKNAENADLILDESKEVLVDMVETK